MKLKWIKYLKTNSNANWQKIPLYILNKLGNNLLIFDMNLDSLKSLNKYSIQLTPFYTELVNTWIEFNKLHHLNKQIENFEHIRKQIIWGNKFIKHKGKCLLYKHWIETGIIFINDLLTEEGNLDTNYIFNKLQNKQNWISEINSVIQSIPKGWMKGLRKIDSIKTQINTKHIIEANELDIKQMTNKQTYNTYIDKYFAKPIMHKQWTNLFKKEIYWNSFYHILHKATYSNDVKQFKYKLVNNIISTNLNLFTWNLKESPLCLLCNELEDYNHFFVTCRFLNNFWKKVNTTFQLSGISKNINKLEYIIKGYKIDSPSYNIINLILNFIGYNIYKTYLLSERRQKFIYIWNFLLNDLNMVLFYLQRKNTNFFLEKFIKNMQ